MLVSDFLTHTSFTIAGTPIMFILSTIYSWLLVGPMSLLGLLIVLLLYPIMVI